MSRGTDPGWLAEDTRFHHRRPPASAQSKAVSRGQARGAVVSGTAEGCHVSGSGEGRRVSGSGEGHPPPQPPTEAVLDPPLLPLLHGRGLVGRLEHGDTATPGEQRHSLTLPRPHLPLPCTRRPPEILLPAVVPAARRYTPNPGHPTPHPGPGRQCSPGAGFALLSRVGTQVQPPQVVDLGLARGPGGRGSEGMWGAVSTAPC